MKKMYVVMSFACLLFSMHTASGQISRGHQVLIDRGLQIKGLIFPCYTDNGCYIDFGRWEQSNFTGFNFNYYTSNIPLMGKPSRYQWGRWVQDQAPPWDTRQLKTEELPYASNLVDLQWWDDFTFTDPTKRAAFQAWVQQTNTLYPNVITHTNSPAYYGTDADWNTMVQTCKPDMVMAYIYPWGGGHIPAGQSSAVHHCYYEVLQKIRAVGLSGHDGAGTTPIPTGWYLQTYLLNSHTPSESELRFDLFACWAFGYKFVTAYVYNDASQEAVDVGGGESALFSTKGYSNPTPAFYQMAEANRQSRNLGPALVKLLCNDVRIIPGQNADPLPAVVNSMSDNFDGNDMDLNDNSGDINWYRYTRDSNSPGAFQVKNNRLRVGSVYGGDELVSRSAVPVPDDTGEKIIITFQLISWASNQGDGDWWRVGIDEDSGGRGSVSEEEKQIYIQQSDSGSITLYTRANGTNTSYTIGNPTSGTSSYRIEIDKNYAYLWANHSSTIPDGTGSANRTINHGYGSDWSNWKGTAFVFARKNTTPTVELDNFNISFTPTFTPPTPPSPPYDNEAPQTVALWASQAIPYITGISATNPGSLNGGCRGDVLVSRFKVLDESFDGTGYTNEVYFMITNGLVDEVADAVATSQQIRIDFNFASSGITGLQRISRDLGIVQVVPLVHDSGSLYHLDMTLDGGTGDLFKFNTGAPFVGAPQNCTEVWSNKNGNKADFNHDCRVDFLDFANLVEDWMMTQVQ